MTNANGSSTRQADGRPPRGARIFLAIVFSFTALIGLAAAQGGIRLLLNGDSNRVGASVAVIMGVILVAASGFYFYRTYFVGPLQAARLARVRRQYPDQPWMERADWASRRVQHTTGFVAVGMWIWVAGWWGFLSFIGWVNHAKIVKAMEESLWNAAMLAVFVGAGLLGLAFAIKLTLHWRRYGVSVLRIDTLPAHPGGAFRGVLEANLNPKPRHPLNADVACEEVLWITTGYGKDRRTRAKVARLGGSRKLTPISRIVASRSGVKCEIEVELPADMPEYSIDEEGNGVRWVLSINTTGDDPPFSCAFDIPVFAPRL